MPHAVRQNATQMNTTSYWVDSASLPHSHKSEKDIRVDVAVVGGGITGVTTAYLFKKAGGTVALIERGRFDYAIFGGEDHKTGQIKNTAEAYKRLKRTFLQLIPNAQIDHQWSGQVIETQDGLPYIGETAERQFAATGFGGNGMTFGTLGAMMAVDAFLKRKNPWADLFYVHRNKIFGGTWKYLSENKDYPYYMVRNWLCGAESKSLRSVKLDQGKIIQLNGHKVAAYRNASGKISLYSPVCTHLGCIIEWNGVERTWDCPCHGSRFARTGEVLSGPAEKPLAKIDASSEK